MQDITNKTTAQRGPPAGPADLIDPMYANLGIYEIADNLLWADNLFYVPSEQNSYARSLLMYDIPNETTNKQHH
jgi:hypothetical protein